LLRRRAFLFALRFGCALNNFNPEIGLSYWSGRPIKRPPSLCGFGARSLMLRGDI
jgi:hypothetical protein